MTCPITPEILISFVVYLGGCVSDFTLGQHECRQNTYNNVEGTIESHLEIAIVVLAQSPEETLFEDGRGKGIRNDHESVRRVGQRLHLQKANLIETTGIDVDGVAVHRSSLRQPFIKLNSSTNTRKGHVSNSCEHAQD